MNKLLIASAITLALGSTVAFAHHPAEFLIQQDGIWDMIDENVSDTPHADMTFDDMGLDDDADVGSVLGEDVGAASNQLEENNAMADSDSPGPGSESQR